MTVYAITDTKKGEQGLRLLIFKLPKKIHFQTSNLFLFCEIMQICGPLVYSFQTMVHLRFSTHTTLLWLQGTLKIKQMTLANTLRQTDSKSFTKNHEISKMIKKSTTFLLNGHHVQSQSQLIYHFWSRENSSQIKFMIYLVIYLVQPHWQVSNQ